MSIWVSHYDIGHDPDDDPREGPPGDVRSYAEDWSNHYPTDDVEKPGAIGVAHIPSYCVPGHDEGEYRTGPWLRLHVATWNRSYGRPMTNDGATVILDVTAARSLAAELLEWADGEHVEPIGESS